MHEVTSYSKRSNPDTHQKSKLIAKYDEVGFVSIRKHLTKLKPVQSKEAYDSKLVFVYLP